MTLSTSGDIQTEFLIRNNRTTTDTFITDVTLRAWEQEAHNYVTSYKKWPFTEGKFSTTYTGVTDETGFAVTDYPENWRTDSIRYATIGGKRYTKINFYKFQSFFEDNPASDMKYISDYARRIYINTIGNPGGSIYLWGQYTPSFDASDLTATTVFSYVDEEGNDAIVEKMSAYLAAREHRDAEATEHDQKAQVKLDAMWKRWGENQFDYQTVPDDGQWKRFDVQRGAMRDDLFRRDRWY